MEKGRAKVNEAMDNEIRKIHFVLGGSSSSSNRYRNPCHERTSVSLRGFSILVNKFEYILMRYLLFYCTDNIS